MLATTGEHNPAPKLLSIRDKSGEPSFGLRLGDFPLTAECATCGQPITLARYYMCEWCHVPQPREPAD